MIIFRIYFQMVRISTLGLCDATLVIFVWDVFCMLAVLFMSLMSSYMSSSYMHGISVAILSRELLELIIVLTSISRIQI